MSGNLAWAEGSFPAVSGLTAQLDGESDYYSLQLNTNHFDHVSLCSGASGPLPCTGWQQFMYAQGQIFMQYWLVGYGDTCPSGWSPWQGSCFQNSRYATAVPEQPLTNLGSLTLTGAAGATDVVTMSIGGTVYQLSQASVLNLDSNWGIAEFNVFANCCGGEIFFTPETSLTVQTLAVSQPPSTAAAVCDPLGYTAETNNMNIVAGSCIALGGLTPGIQFTESTPPYPPPPALVPTASIVHAGKTQAFTLVNGELAGSALWSATEGTMVGDVYHAPATVSAKQQVTVTLSQMIINPKLGPVTSLVASTSLTLEP